MVMAPLTAKILDASVAPQSKGIRLR